MAIGDPPSGDGAQTTADAKAIDALHAAVAVLAAAVGSDPSRLRPYAVACRHLAERLVAADRIPEAAQAYQEAADAFSLLPDGDAEARQCAKAVVEGVRSLWRRPEERLLLLVTHHDREMRRLAQQPDTEHERARIAFHLGTVLQRRDRFAMAAERYAQALALLEARDGTELDKAACHQRLAGLYHHELADPRLAERHYRAAIALYSAFEPVTDGEQVERALCEELLRGLLQRP